MSTTLFSVNVLINEVNMVQALVDNGYLFSGIINDALVSKLKLPRFNISPRSLQTAENLATNRPIYENITYFELDLDGHLNPKLWLYIVPYSAHKIILGKRWLEDQDAIIHSKEQRLELRKKGGSIYVINLWRHKLRNVARPKVTSI